MREIKFRAWHKKYKEMFEVSCLSPKTYLPKNSRGRRDHNSFKIEDSVIEQYTGLKDKNGKEIYEGDRYRWEGTSDGYIAWEDGCFIGIEYDDDNMGYPLNDICGDIEIIGNIHEGE